MIKIKQRISVDQLQELTPGQQEKLREWWQVEKGDWYIYNFKWENVAKFELEGDICGHDYPTVVVKKNCLPLLSIGQMLQFLQGKTSAVGETWVDLSYDSELIDALFQAVKEIL